MNKLFILWLEAFFVGCYSLFVYVFYSCIFSPLLTFASFFCIGFIKHFFGYVLGIHTFYCNHKLEKLERNKNGDKIATSKQLFLFSVMEGFIYAIVGQILLPYTRKQPLLLFFILGASLHLLSEIIGVHSFFIQNNCKNKTT